MVNPDRNWMGIQPPGAAMPGAHQSAAWISTGCQARGKRFEALVATVARMQTAAPKLSMTQVLACGAMVVTLSMGIRHGFGLWLQPITQAQGWDRQTFSFALAIQNLAWGFIGIFAGMLADRFGAFRVLALGAVLYALGLAGMALAPDAFVFTLTTGVLIGTAQAGTTYAVIYGVIGCSHRPKPWRMPIERVTISAPQARTCIMESLGAGCCISKL